MEDSELVITTTRGPRRRAPASRATPFFPGHEVRRHEEHLRVCFLHQLAQLRRKVGFRFRGGGEHLVGMIAHDGRLAPVTRSPHRPATARRTRCPAPSLHRPTASRRCDARGVLTLRGEFPGCHGLSRKRGDRHRRPMVPVQLEVGGHFGDHRPDDRKVEISRIGPGTRPKVGRPRCCGRRRWRPARPR